MKTFLLSLSGRYFREQRAATAVEFGLVALPFLLLLFGIIEAGRIVWTMNGVQYAVEETCRYASLNSELDEGAFQTYADEKISDMLISSEPLALTSTFFTTNGVDFVEIEGEYSVTPILDIFPDGFGYFDFTATTRKPVIE